MSASGAGEAPLIAGKIQGVRGWSLSGATLGAAVQGDEWAADGKATRATCRNQRRHKSPVKECGCGLYGTHPWAGGTQGEILGVIEAWGRVELHATGFRAERARPIALFVVADETTLAEVRVLHQVAERYECELIELQARGEIEAECRRRDWGLGREVVAELVPATETWEAPAGIPAPPGPGRGERIRQGLEMAFVGAISLAYAAFWGFLALGVIAAITGWHPLGWDSDAETEPALVRAPEVRIVDEAIVPPDGKVPPVYVAVLKNRGREAAIWARPKLTYASDAERVDVGRTDFGYPAVVPAGSRALVVQPLNGADPKTVEVRPGPISARDVERPPRAPATVSAELKPLDGSACKLVADIHAKTSLERLRIWLLPVDGEGEPPLLLQRGAGAIPAGRSQQLLDRFRDCPANLPEIRAFPAFGAGQLVE